MNNDEDNNIRPPLEVHGPNIIYVHKPQTSEHNHHGRPPAPTNSIGVPPSTRINIRRGRTSTPSTAIDHSNFVDRSTMENLVDDVENALRLQIALPAPRPRVPAEHPPPPAQHPPHNR